MSVRLFNSELIYLCLLSIKGIDNRDDTAETVDVSNDHHVPARF